MLIWKALQEDLSRLSGQRRLFPKFHLLPGFSPDWLVGGI